MGIQGSFENPDDDAIRSLLERMRRSAGRAGAFDLVDVFRRSGDLPSVFENALAAKAGALWFQLGCIDHDDARRAQAQGVTVVMDRCLMVGPRAPPGPDVEAYVKGQGLSRELTTEGVPRAPCECPN